MPPVCSFAHCWASLSTYTPDPLRSYRGISMRETLQCRFNAWPGKPDISLHFPWQKPQRAVDWQPVPAYQHAMQLSNTSLHQYTHGHSLSCYILPTNLTERACVRAQRHPPLMLSWSWRMCTFPYGKLQTGSDSDQSGCQPMAASHLHTKHGWFWVGTGVGRCLTIKKMDFRHYSHIHTSHSVVYLLPATSSNRKELQLLMAPITEVIIACIELNLVYSSIFMCMTWKLISHSHFFYNKAKSFGCSLKGSK